MTTLNDLLKNVKQVKLDDLLLDPNNPRFMQHANEHVPEEKIADPAVQQKAMEEMLHQNNNFEIDELVDAILADGFIEVDKIFVRKLGAQYLVVEGNRRVTSLKRIVSNHALGKKGFKELPAGFLESISTIPCVVLDTQNEAEAQQLIRKILGLRHHGSILPWKPLPASFNLYHVYMMELCGDEEKAANPENFVYVPAVAKKVKEMFSVRLADVRNRVRLYRTYQQLVEASHSNTEVMRPESFSMIEETIKSKALRGYLKFDDNTATFAEEGVEQILDLYYGLKGKEKVIRQASAGDSNVRDFGIVVDEGKEKDVDRIVTGRENAEAVRTDVRAASEERNLPSALEMIFNILKKINLGAIGFDGFSPSEIVHLENIEKILSQLKAAAGKK